MAQKSTVKEAVTILSGVQTFLHSKLETVSLSNYTVLQKGSLYVTKAKFLGQTLISIRKHSGINA